MPRSTPPQLISYVETTWNASTGTSGALTTPSVSWLAGDVIVIAELVENAGNLDTLSTTGGYTPTQVVANPTSANSNVCAANVWADKVVANGSGTFSSLDGSGRVRGQGVWVWRGSDGLGSNFKQNTSGKTVADIPTDTHSAWCWVVADFAAAANGGSVLAPAASDTRQNGIVVGTNYTIWVGDITDMASGASQNFGIGAGTASAGPFAIAGVEILGTTGGGVAFQPHRMPLGV